MRSFGLSKARGRRSAPRGDAVLEAVLSTELADHTAALIDISRTGARLQGRNLPVLGERLTFTAEDVRAHADVVWREADLCAVEFGTPIAAAEVQRLRFLTSG